jgi:hypothetical protein
MLTKVYPLLVVAVGSVQDMLLHETPGIVAWHSSRVNTQPEVALTNQDLTRNSP